MTPLRDRLQDRGTVGAIEIQALLGQIGRSRTGVPGAQQCDATKPLAPEARLGPTLVPWPQTTSPTIYHPSGDAIIKPVMRNVFRSTISFRGMTVTMNEGRAGAYIRGGVKSILHYAIGRVRELWEAADLLAGGTVLPPRPRDAATWVPWQPAVPKLRRSAPLSFEAF
jgi:hypothetical protein